jgi:hypothetical protein
MEHNSAHWATANAIQCVQPGSTQRNGVCGMLCFAPALPLCSPRSASLLRTVVCTANPVWLWVIYAFGSCHMRARAMRQNSTIFIGRLLQMRYCNTAVTLVKILNSIPIRAYAYGCTL